MGREGKIKREKKGKRTKWKRKEWKENKKRRKERGNENVVKKIRITREKRRTDCEK